jgi:hypothetical protein
MYSAVHKETGQTMVPEERREGGRVRGKEG